MRRLVGIALVAVPLMTLASAPAYAEVKTRDKALVKFEGMLGRVFNLFGGKAAKEGIENKVAVKGNRKATVNDSTGTIIDLSEEKVYDLDMKKKTYTVKTFDQIRKEMREAEEKARKEAEKIEKEEPAQREEPQKSEKPQKEYEFDFDVKETGQKKQIAGYDTRQAIATVTVREKGKTLEESGGMVMTSDMWLGPEIPQLEESWEFDMKYAAKLAGPEAAAAAAVSAEQMAQILAMFPLVGKAQERMAKDGDKLKGTPLETTVVFETVKSKEVFEQEQKQAASGSGGGGIGGLLAKKIMKKEPPKQRGTIMTSKVETLEIATTVAADDLAIPAGFKEKK